MSKFADLRRRGNLARMLRSLDTGINTTSLETEFLSLSANKKNVLFVESENTYCLQPEHRRQVKQIEKKEGLESRIAALDFTGGTRQCPDLAIFTSVFQSESTHVLPGRSDLINLAKKIYTVGGKTLELFGVHEVLYGIIKKTVNGKSLEESVTAKNTGIITIELTLDTASEHIKRFKKIENILQQLRKSTVNEKKRFLLSPQLEKLSELALALRQEIGALGRYKPVKNTFTIETTACNGAYKGANAHYIYTPTGRNIVIHFGKEESTENALNANESSHTLKTLLNYGLYNPSNAALVAHTQRLRGLAEEATDNQELQKLAEELENIQTRFRTIVNREARRSYLAEIQPELLEFAVCPAYNHPMVVELLPRLSWNETTRAYHNTNQFKKKFADGTTKEKKVMLDKTKAQLLVHPQQNVSVNNWLYEQYRDMCEEQQITFEKVV